MRTAGLALVAALVLGTVAGNAHATTGTCTITTLDVLTLAGSAGQLTFHVPVANGVAMPVEFDEATGKFSMSRDTWANMFGADGGMFDTGFGPEGWVIMVPGTVSGTIDGDGNVVLPDFASAFATNFCRMPPRDRSPDYPIAPSLTSTEQILEVGGEENQSRGRALDFGTGVLTLEGADIIPDACGAGGPVLSGYHLACTLSPIPDRSKLGAGPMLMKVSGKGKVGKPLPTTPATAPDKGDALTFKASIEPGIAPIDFTQRSFFRVIAGDKEIVSLEIPAGKFQKKGSGFVFMDKPPDKSGKDADGQNVVIFVGQKSNPAVSSAVAGTVKVKMHKTAFQLSGKFQGLDVSGLTGSGSVAVEVGAYFVSADVTMSGGGKSRKFR